MDTFTQDTPGADSGRKRTASPRWTCRWSSSAFERKTGGLGLWLRDLLVSAVASVLIITFLYQPVRVEGTSMLPRLEDQRPPLHQQVRLPLLRPSSAATWWSFTTRAIREKSYIKRVIALPGDELRIDDGRRTGINGKLLPEPYVPGISRQPLQAEIVIPPGRVLRHGRSPLHFVRQPRLRTG